VTSLSKTPSFAHADLNAVISLSNFVVSCTFPFVILKDALLHESDISQLSLKSSNQMIDMTSELLIVDPETA